MLPRLIKKDFLIVKKYVLLMAAVCLGFPILLLYRVPEYAGVLGYVMVTSISVFLLLMQLSLEEGLSPRAASLLCAAPYSRAMLVIARYCFLLLIFLGASLLFWLETLVFPGFGPLRPQVFLPSLLALSVFLGVYLPLQYRLGFENARFLLMLAILGVSFLFPQLLKMGAGDLISRLFTRGQALLSVGIPLASVLILTGSILTSIHIYRRRDLA